MSAGSSPRRSKKDTINKPVDALLEIYRKMRPGDPPTVPTAYRLLEGMFFDARRFDLSRVGRLKFNIKMNRPERHRSSRQPPRSRGRRAARKPVPHRS
ncbi:MAG: hypothetical protein IPK58_03670 [Acidobacteria bacterium]|nr:hypothetical protein [Acidobacteriota bacterium]